MQSGYNVSDRFGSFSDCFQLVSDRFRSISNHFGTVSDRFGTFSDPFGQLHSSKKSQISIAQAQPLGPELGVVEFEFCIEKSKKKSERKQIETKTNEEERKPKNN